MFINHIILILFFILSFYQLQKIASTHPGSMNERSLNNIELNLFSMSVYFRNELIQEEFNNLNVFMIPNVKDYVLTFINNQIKHGQQFETFYLEFIFFFYLLLLVCTYFTLSNYLIPSLLLIMNYGTSLYKYYLLNKDTNIIELEPWKSMDFMLNSLLIFFILINCLCCSCTTQRKKITIPKSKETLKQEEMNKSIEEDKSENSINEFDEKKEIPEWQ